MQTLASAGFRQRWLVTSLRSPLPECFKRCENLEFDWIIPLHVGEATL